MIAQQDASTTDARKIAEATGAAPGRGYGG
jgi:hypothetical protein